MTAKLTRLTLGLVWTILAVAACGGSSLGEARSSGIENVPIPAEAESAGQGEWTVSASYDDLRAWYDKQMPIGANFTPWHWCEANTVGPSVLQRLYGRVGTTSMLSVMIGDGSPSRIDIRADDSGPC